MAGNAAPVPAGNDSHATDRELIVSRVFDAPRDLAFDAFTRPEHVARWWAPDGFTIVSSDMDVRPGGTWRLVLRTPGGGEFANLITYREVARPQRLVYVYSAGPEQNAESDVETTLSFADERGKTRVTMRLVFPSAAVRDYAVTKYGAEQGAKGALDRAAHYAEQLTRPNVDAEYAVQNSNPVRPALDEILGLIAGQSATG